MGSPITPPLLPDRCLSSLLERFLATLHEGVDRRPWRRGRGTQGEEKFCLRERRLGIAVAIELEARQREVRLGGFRGQRNSLRQRLFRLLPIARGGERFALRQPRGIGGEGPPDRPLEPIDGPPALAPPQEQPAQGPRRP